MSGSSENSQTGIIVAVAGLALTALVLLINKPLWVAVTLDGVLLFVVVAWYEAAKSEGNLDNIIAGIVTVFLLIVIPILFLRQSDQVKLYEYEQRAIEAERQRDAAIDMIVIQEISGKNMSLEEKAKVRKKVEDALGMHPETTVVGDEVPTNGE